MKTILYINNDQVKILEAEYKKGEIKARRSIRYDLTAGSVINGVIINENEIINILAENKKLLNKATVVLNSSNIHFKNLVHPNLKGKKLNSYLKNEFSISDDGNVVYGASTRKFSNVYKSISAGVPKELLEKYFDLFKRAGIKVGRFEILQNGMAKYVGDKKDLKDQTFVLNLVEGNNLISVLVEAGEYVLTERSRLMNDPGTDEYVDELLQKLSIMVQFNISRKSPNKITSSYYIGLDQEELDKIKDVGKSRNISEDISGFIDHNGLDRTALEYFPCYMGIIENDEDIDFIKNHKKQLRNSRKKNWGFIAVASSLILCLGLFSFLKLDNLRLEEENKRLASEMNTVEDKNELDRLIAMEKKLLEIPVILAEYDQLKGGEGSSASIDSGLLSRMMSTASNLVMISGIEGDLEKGNISVRGTGTDQLSISKFISELRNTGLFIDIEYNGYTGSGDNQYSFSVDCILKK